MLGVFSMDLAFFESSLPIVSDIVSIVTASGWALLLGNFVFQAAKSMMSGLGFEADDPRELFARTFVFGFCLLASRQICNIGLGLSSSLIALLQIPDAVSVTIPDENAFAIGASWLLVIVIGLVLIWQLIKLFFAVGERYFLVGLLTILAPWAFAMGGSRATSDIFKGWLRMFASMCLMMVLNVVILKLFISAMGYMPSGPECVPWVILVVAIARVGKKIDGVVMKIGLNPAATGGGGRSLPGMLTYTLARSVISKTMSSAGGRAGASGAESAPDGANASSFSSRSTNTSRGSSRNTSKTSTRGNDSARAPSGAASGQTRTSHSTTGGGTANGTLNNSADNSSNARTSISGAAGSAEKPASGQSRNQNAPARRGAERGMSAMDGGAQRQQDFPGSAKKPVDIYYSEPRGVAGTASSDNMRRSAEAQNASHGVAGKSAVGNQSSPKASPSNGASKASRFTAIPPNTRKSVSSVAHGGAGTGARSQSGNANGNTQSGISAHQSESRRDRYSASESNTVNDVPASGQQAPGVAGIPPRSPANAAERNESRRPTPGKSDTTDAPSGITERSPRANAQPESTRGSPASRERAPRPAENISPARRAQTDSRGVAGISPPVQPGASGGSRHISAEQARRSAANSQPSTPFPAQSGVPRAASRESAPRKPETLRQTRSVPGAAGTASRNVSGDGSKQSPPYTPRQPADKGVSKPGGLTTPKNNGKSRKKKHRRGHQ